MHPKVRNIPRTTQLPGRLCDIWARKASAEGPAAPHEAAAGANRATYSAFGSAPRTCGPAPATRHPGAASGGASADRPQPAQKKRTSESVCSLPHVSAARPHPQPFQKNTPVHLVPCAPPDAFRTATVPRSGTGPATVSRPATHNGPHHRGTPPAGKRSAGRTAVRATPRRYGCRRSGRGFPVQHPCRGSPTGDSTAYRPAPS